VCFFLFPFFRFLVKYFQLCICIVTVLLPFVVNKAYQNDVLSRMSTKSWVRSENKASYKGMRCIPLTRNNAYY